MLRSCILGALLSVGTITATVTRKSDVSRGRTRINTQMNTVGIADDDVCYVTKDKKKIRCASGKVIKNPLQRESALTGTPGHLSGTNYIGFMVSKPSTPSLMGSGKRIDFFAQ